MSFKETPWDFFKKHKRFFVENKKVYSLYCYDPFIERMILNKLIKKNSVKKVNVIDVSFVDEDWIENNLCYNDLFGDEKTFIILNAENLSSKAKERLLIEKLEHSPHCLIMSFGKSVTFLNKRDDIVFYSIPEPPFWFFKNIINFLCTEFKVQLSSGMKDYLYENIEHSVGSFINVLKTIKISFQDTVNLKGSDIEPFIEKTRFDKFFLAEQYGQKNFDTFYSYICERDFSYEDLRDLFSFMQNHLIKMSDISFMEEKKRLSQYDKSLVMVSKKWNSLEIEQSRKIFQDFEILAKSKSEFLATQIRVKWMEIGISS